MCIEHIYLTAAFELIDTLWNVNYIDRLFLYSKSAELIDTLWNVNEEYEKSHNDTGGGINRYIMEYKR